MNGWGQFFLGVLTLFFLAGSHRRWIRYRIVKRMVEAECDPEDIVDVLDVLNQGNIVDRYIDSDGGG